MRLSNSLLTILLLPTVLVGIACDSAEPPRAVVFSADALSDISYHFVGLDGTEAVVLLGTLSFAESEGGTLAGSWQLAPWGEQEPFAALPGGGSFTGFIHGDRAILRIEWPGTDTSLGLVVEGLRDDRLVGSLILQPGMQFEGRFEAIEAPGTPSRRAR